MTLSEFLLERIAEEEGAAREIPAGVFEDACSISRSYEYVFRWAPDRVLDECEAKRRIVEEHSATDQGEFYSASSKGSQRISDDDEAWVGLACEACGEWSEYGVPWPCLTLRLLALPYADHPDYLEEWKV